VASRWIIIILHQTHYEKSDWSRAFNQFTIQSWIIKPSCLCYLPQSSASADNTDLGNFDNSWYHAQPHPIIVYYLLKPKAEAHNWSARHCFIIQSPFFWSMKYVKSLSACSGNRSAIFTRERSFNITHEQSIICSKTFICRQLFSGHMVSSRPMKRKEKDTLNDDNYFFIIF